MATKKSELSLPERLDLAVQAGFDTVLQLNNKQDNKKVFRAAVGHGYHEVGPVAVSADTLGAWAQALVRHCMGSLMQGAPKELEAALKRGAAAQAKIETAKTDGVRATAMRALGEASARVAYCKRWLSGAQAEMDSEVVEVAQHCARGLHTHDGKLIHAEAQVRLFKPAKPVWPRVPYLFSDTAASERQLSAGFAHKPAASEPALLFHAVFVFEGVQTTFAQLLQASHPLACAALLQAGLSEAVVARLPSIFTALGAVPPHADPSLPQQLWPVSEGYCALQAAPSLATYAALVHERRRVREGQYLRISQVQVGSGQAQNVSIFASSTSGFLTLLQCTPPRVRVARVATLKQRCWRRSLVATAKYKSNRRDTDFEQDISHRPNAQRERFLRAFAVKHAVQALAQLNEVRDAYDEACEEWVLAVARLDVEERAFVKNERLLAVHVAALFEKVLRCLPRESVETHTPQDRELYRALVEKELTKECRG